MTEALHSNHGFRFSSCGVRRITARLRAPALLLSSVVLLTGCMSLAKPDQVDRDESFARGARALAAHRGELEKVTYLVFASDSPASFDLAEHGDTIDLSFKNAKLISGLATAVSSDGYLLTAAHVFKKYCYVVGWMNGRQRVAKARLVYRELGREFGQELAILHVDRHLDSPIPLGALDATSDRVYAFACDRHPKLRIIVVEGKILHRPDPAPGRELSVLEMDLPLWKGDSGAAVISRDGKLVGVFVGLARSLTTFKVSRVACVPDMDRVASMIDKDRSSTKAHSRP